MPPVAAIKRNEFDGRAPFVIHVETIDIDAVKLRRRLGPGKRVSTVDRAEIMFRGHGAKLIEAGILKRGEPHKPPGRYPVIDHALALAQAAIFVSMVHLTRPQGHCPP
jgi:hypothetical protein